MSRNFHVGKLLATIAIVASATRGAEVTAAVSTVTSGTSFSSAHGHRNHGFFEIAGSATTGVGVDIHVGVQQIESFKDYIYKSGIAINGKAAFGRFGIEGGHNVTADLQNSESKLVYLLQIEGRFAASTNGQYMMLSDRGQAFLNRTDMDTFLRLVGTHVVTAVNRGIRSEILVTIQASDSAKRKAIESHLKATWLSASATCSLSKTVTQIDSHAAIHVSVDHQGSLSSLPHLAEIVRANPGDVDAIRAAMANCLRDSNVDRCPVVAFESMPLSLLPEIAVVDGGSDAVERAIRLEEAIHESAIDLTDRLLTLRTQRKQVDAVLLHADEENLVQDGRAGLKATRKDLANQIVEVEKQIDDLFHANSIDEVRKIRLPTLERLKIARFIRRLMWLSAWRTRSWHDLTNCVSDETINCHSQFTPLVEMPFPQLVRSIRVQGRLTGDPNVFHARLVQHSQTVAFASGAQIAAISAAKSLEPVFTSIWTYRNQRAWGRHADQVESKIDGIETSTRRYESSLVWEVVLTDIDGVEHCVPLGSVSNLIPDES